MDAPLIGGAAFTRELKGRKMKKRGTFTTTALLVALAMLLPGTPANAAASDGHAVHVSKQLTYHTSQPTGSATVSPNAPQAVKDEVQRITRAGGTILAIASSEYREKNSNGSQTRSFPSNCGLHVIASKNGDYIQNSSLTSCLFPVTAMEMFGGVARSRFLGQWEQMETGDAYNEGRPSLTLTVSYYCRGTGTHDFQVVTNGELIKGGTTYTASAWDQIDHISC